VDRHAPTGAQGALRKIRSCVTFSLYPW
jgi:hypothetical protein